MSDWPTQTVGSLLADDRGISVGVMYPGEDTAGGIPLVRVGDVTEAGINPIPSYRISSKTHHEYRRTALLGGECLITLVGRPGLSVVVPQEMAGWNAARALAVVRLKNPEDAKFLTYALRAPSVQNTIRNWCNTTVQATLNLKEIRALPVPWPERPIRIAIADALSCYVDKIELNRRMNEVLEGMAQAVFRDWFIDFGPVRRALGGASDPVAIMGGIIPDSARAAHLAALFPATFGNDGLPLGWSERPLDSIAEFLNGLALQKYPAKPGEPDLPVIKIAELRNGLSVRSNRAARSLPTKYIVKDGDFIFSWSGSLLAKVWTEGEGALNQHLFKVSSDDYPQWFYGLWVHHHMPEFQLIAASKATTMGHIQRMHLTKAATVCPPASLIEAMSTVMQPLWDRMINNELENRTLAETRDYLLPRLMSGAVRVTPQAEAA